MAIEHGANFSRHRTRGGNRIIKIGKQLIPKHIKRAAKLGRATRAKARCHADQLDRQVIANDLEYINVIGERCLGAFPANFQHAKDLRAVKNGKTDLAAVRRHILHAQQVLRTIVQIHKHARGDTVALKVLLNRQTASARLAKHVGRNARAVRHKLGQIAILKLLRNTAELKATALRKINRSSRSIERSDELI